MILHGIVWHCLVFLVLQSIGGESSFPLLVLNLVVLIWMECCRIKWHPTPWIGSPRSLETGKSIHQHFLMWKHFVKNTKAHFSWIGLSTKFLYMGISVEFWKVWQFKWRSWVESVWDFVCLRKNWQNCSTDRHRPAESKSECNFVNNL